MLFKRFPTKKTRQARHHGSNYTRWGVAKASALALYSLFVLQRVLVFHNFDMNRPLSCRKLLLAGLQPLPNGTAGFSQIHHKSSPKL
jgi:hypothetical protein